MSDAGRDWGQEEKGTTEDEMAGWHHRLDGREFGWTPGVGDGQGGLACYDSWGRKESDTTEWLNWTELSMSQITNNGSKRYEINGNKFYRSSQNKPLRIKVFCILNTIWNKQIMSLFFLMAIFYNGI